MPRVLNVTAVLEELVREGVAKVPELSHIDPSRVLVCVSSAKGNMSHGVYAKIYPLRFPGGARTGHLERRGRLYRCEMPEVKHQGREILYVIYFLVPRFLDLSPRQKLLTLFHELYHISPSFDGDIRRFPGRNYAHGSSRKKYNAAVEAMLERYLPLASGSHTDFLDHDCSGLRSRFGNLVGRKMAVPRLKHL